MIVYEILPDYCLLLVLSSSCKAQQLVIKFKNKSGENFKDFQTEILGEKHLLGYFKKGTTKTIRINKSYRYCNIMAVTSNDTLKLTPIDYVGEKLYTKGKIIMKLSISQNENGKRRLLLATKISGKKDIDN